MKRILCLLLLALQFLILPVVVTQAAGISPTTALYEGFTETTDKTGDVLDQKAKYTADIEKLQEKLKEFEAETRGKSNIQAEMVRAKEFVEFDESLEESQKNERIEQQDLLIIQIEEEILVFENEKLQIQEKIDAIVEEIEFIDLTAEKKSELKLKDSLVNIQSLLRIMLVIVATIIVGSIVKFLSRRYIKEKKRRRTIRTMINNMVSVLIVLQVLLFILSDISYFLPILALTGTALAFGLRDFIVAFISWFFITSPRGYKIGDLIQIDDIKGYISNISMLRTSMKEIDEMGFTGNVVVFSNKKTVESSLKNYTKHSTYFWDTITFTVSTFTEGELLQEKLDDSLSKFYDVYLEKALKQWHRSTDHPYPRFEKEPTQYLLKKDEDHWCLTVKYVTSLSRMFEMKKALYRVENSIATKDKSGDHK